ncbi:MAG: DegV family protein [Anaerolineae bacterium]
MADYNPHIALITDSTCDIPPHLLEQYHITFASQYLIWGSEEYRDRVTITPDEFYKRLAHEQVSPTSSQPTAQDFLKLLGEAKAAGAEEAVIITISSQLSGTVESARQAAALTDIPVHVMDSRSGGSGLGWQVLAAARARDAGGDAQAMLAAADRARETLRFIFFVDSLDSLHRGGRIGGASLLIGTVLNLKPVLYVNHDAGRVEAGERTRTRKKALERIYELFFSQVDVAKPLHVAVVHSGALEDAEHLAERARAEFSPAELYVQLISPVMGTHIGPGAVGIAGYHEA